MNVRHFMRRLIVRLGWLFCGLLLPSQFVVAGEIRLGVLKFGTVNWELDAMVHNGFAADEGVDLTIVEERDQCCSTVWRRRYDRDRLDLGLAPTGSWCRFHLRSVFCSSGCAHGAARLEYQEPFRSRW